MAISSGLKTCGTSPTLLCTLGESGGIVNASAVGVFIGGPNVAVSGANAGIPLPATTNVTLPGARARGIPVVPAVADDSADVYMISTAGTQTVSFFAPQGG